MPGAVESTHVRLGLLQLHRAREGCARSSDAPVVTPDAAEWIRPCPGLSRLRRAQEEKEQNPQIPGPKPDTGESPHPSSSWAIASAPRSRRIRASSTSPQEDTQCSGDDPRLSLTVASTP